jgi:hypothetical protein
MTGNPPTLKERLENNIVLVVIGFLLAGFSAGYGVHSALSGSALFGGSSAQGVDWRSLASENGWMDKNSCPALPVNLRLLSPGDNATIRLSRGGYLESDLVISSSQPLPAADSVGVVVKAEVDPNFYVSFPYFDENEHRTVFRHGTLIEIPNKIEKPTHVDIWAFVDDDKRNLGNIYGSLDQIKAVSNTIFLSDKIGITVVPEQ